MITHTARTVWNGALETGSGRVTLADSDAREIELTPSKAGTYTGSAALPLDQRPAGADPADPNELVAAAYSSSVATHLVTTLAQRGDTPERLEVRADVASTVDTAGAYLTAILLVIRGTVRGLDEEGFIAATGLAIATCPMVKALAGLEITVHAALD